MLSGKISKMTTSVVNIGMKNLSRSVSTVTLGNYTQNIFDQSDMSSCKNHVKNKKIATIGYGPQGRAQSQNLRDNGFDVCIGVRKGRSFDLALEDGWVEGRNLFEVEEACDKGDIIQYLLSDAGQMRQWHNIKKYLTSGKTLYFSHGFSIVNGVTTGVIPPNDIDVIMVAPKGPGGLLREKMLNQDGIVASIAVENDHTGNAFDTCLGIAHGIGASACFETTFTKETNSDLFGECSNLMGGIEGVVQAGFEELIRRGHSPLEAGYEVIEEGFNCLYQMVNDKGMDWMFRNCSATAQRGALEWKDKYKEANAVVAKQLYDSVESGEHARMILEETSKNDYRETLEQELEKIDESLAWQTAKVIRDHRIR